MNKKFNVNSEQLIGLYFRDLRNQFANIESLNVEVKAYTTKDSALEFSINKGVVTNCVKSGNSVYITANEIFEPGILNFDVKVIVENSKFPDQKQTVFNSHSSNIQIVDANTQVQNQQYEIFADVKLPILMDFTNSGIIPPDFDEALVKRVIQDEITKKEIAAGDLSNVSPDDLNTLLLLTPAYSNLALKDLSNVEDNTLSNKVKSTDAYSELAQKDLSNVTPDAADSLMRKTNLSKEIEKHFEQPLPALAYYEVQNAIIDWVNVPEQFVQLTYQFDINNENQIITQKLPPLVNNKYIIIKVINLAGNAKLVLQPNDGEQIDGSTNSIEIKENGLIGDFLPESINNNYLFVHYSAASNNITEFQPVNSDGSLGIPFKANNIKLSSPLQGYSDPNKQNGGILLLDPSSMQGNLPDGYFANLDSDETISSKMIDKIWFRNVVVPSHGGISIDKVNKRIGIQELDDKDPNITGGMEYALGFYANLKGIAASDGYVEIFIKDTSTGTYLKDENGNDIAVKKQYKLGDKLDKLLIMNIVKVTGLKYIQFDVKTNITGDFVTLESDSCILVQSYSKQYKTGLAEIEFTNRTGYKFNIEHRYYYNDFKSINKYLENDQPLSTGQPFEGKFMTNGMNFSNVTPMQLGITDKTLLLKDTGAMAYFSLGWIFDNIDTANLIGKQLRINLNLKNIDGAYNVQVVKWDGDQDAYTTKIITDINNSTPTLEPNWELVGSPYFIAENPSGTFLDYTTNLTVPDCKNFAIILYPVNEQSPLDLSIKKFSIDSITQFTETIVRNPIEEKYITNSERYAKFGMNVEGFAVLRYTINNTETKCPFGYKISGNIDLENIMDWKDSGVPGEGGFKANTDANFRTVPSFRIHLGEDATRDQLLEIYFKDATTNTIVGNSATYTFPFSQKDFVNITLSKISFPVTNGTTYDMYMKTTESKGLYIQSNGASQYLIMNDITFDEII